MNWLILHPRVLFVVSLVLMWSATRLGVALSAWRDKGDEVAGDRYGLIVGATLTLTGLIVGFSFSMSVGRYDQRKNLEAGEANAIGTEYVRADLLADPAAAAKARTLLKAYLERRILFYTSRDDSQLREVDVRTAQLQKQLWEVTRAAGAAQPTPVVALAVSGMNDVLNSQGYAQAAWWNTIPSEAWLLMMLIALCGNALVGAGTRDAKAERRLSLVLPLMTALSFFLIADIDSPRNGVIRVTPQNLQSLADSFRAP